MLRIWCVFGFLIVVLAASPTRNVASKTSRMASAITTQGYVAETHHVTTEDGYILGVFRIPYARYQNSANESRPVVLCMHGLYGQSQNYIALPPELGLGYNLADAGFDVWFGNARGNIHSRSHVTLDPDVDNMEFFDFSWEEIGMYDVPAMIDYVLEYTGREKLHYIGHSQGGTTFLVMGSMRPEYNEKLASVHLLAGVGYQEYFPNEELRSIAQLTDLIYAVAISEGLAEVDLALLENILGGGGSGDGQVVSRADLCFGDIKYKRMCDLIGARHYLRDYYRENANGTSDESMEGGGGSLKQIAHYGQNIRDKLFRRFDYGTSLNQEKYGTTSPPLYDLSLITSNVVMHYTLNDILLDERDVLAMAADMPSTVARKVARESFEHSDFVIAPDAKELVTDFIIQSIIDVHNGVSNSDAEDIEADEAVETTASPPVTSAPITDSAMTFSLNMILMYTLLCASYIIL